MRPRTITLIHAGHRHVIFSRAKPRYRGIVLEMRPEMITDFPVLGKNPSAAILPNAQRPLVQIQVDGRSFQQFQRLINRIESAIVDKTPTDAASAVIPWLMEIFSILARPRHWTNSISVPASPDDLKMIAQVKRIVDEMLLEDPAPQIEQIAQRIHMSPGHLRRLFSRYKGFGLGEYILGRRMDRACTLLRLGYSVSTSAQACGYGDVSSFTKAFAKRFGVLPSEVQVRRPHAAPLPLPCPSSSVELDGTLDVPVPVAVK